MESLNRFRMVQISDEELVKRSLKDVDSFGLLIERYESKLKAYIMRISTFSPAEIEEILQEIFLKAWKNLRDFDQSLKFSSWIYRIAHNQTVSSFRKYKSRGLDKDIPLDLTLYNIASSELDISEKLDQKTRAKVVCEILNSLPEKYREVLVLKYLEEKSYEEISDILKRPMGTIATLLNRAKKAFKKKLLEKNLNL